jgi:hypothetical protein
MASAVFSNREWQGAERDRSEKQLQDELDAARDALSPQAGGKVKQPDSQ